MRLPSSQSADPKGHGLHLLPRSCAGTSHWLGGVMLVVCQIAYIAGSSFHLRPPQLLPLTPLDLGIPLVPWTVLVYLTDIPFFIATYFLLNDTRRVRYVLEASLVCLTACAIFVALPVAYPRERFPVPARPDLSCEVLRHVRLHDDPAGAFPSLHVAVSVLSPLAFWESGSGWRRSMVVIWCLAITVSTMTTKQHYAVDVAGGGLLALGIHHALGRLLKSRGVK